MKLTKSLVSEWLHFTEIVEKDQCFVIHNLCPHNGCILLATDKFYYSDRGPPNNISGTQKVERSRLKEDANCEIIY